jgi:hypothetical protein
MTAHQSTRDIVPTLVEWATARSAIRAMLLTSTRTIPGTVFDVLSGCAVVPVVQDIHRFVAGAGLPSCLGRQPLDAPWGL